MANVSVYDVAMAVDVFDNRRIFVGHTLDGFTLIIILYNRPNINVKQVKLNSKCYL